MRRFLVLMLAVVPALGAASSAAAAPPPLGGLTQLPGSAACVSDTAFAPCVTTSGFYGPTDVAVSPDGNDVYVASNSDAAVAHLRRGAGGALSYADCVSQNGHAGSATCATFAPLSNLEAVTVSPDGRNVYAASRNTNGVITTFDRDPATGKLTVDPAHPCISDTALPPCADGRGIASVVAIAVDPGGRAVFTGSSISKGGVSVLARDPNTGALSMVDCVNADGHDGCGTGPGLDDVEGVDVSPDGRFVYSAARGGSAVDVVAYDAASHKLAYRQCFTGTTTPPAGCTAIGGVFAPNAIAVSQNTTGVGSVYTAAFNQDATTIWTRDPDSGLLSYSGCRSFTGDINSNIGVCQVDPVVQGVTDVAISPDAATVYLIGERSNPDQGSQAIGVYARSKGSGALTPFAGADACWADKEGAPANVNPLTVCHQAFGMYDPAAVAVAPAGDAVYVASGSLPSSIAVFARQVAPSCSATTATVAAGTTVTLTLPCTDRNGDPLTRTIVSAPAHGTLGTVAADGSVPYTPAAGFSGTDSLTFAASDGAVASDAATATITVTPVAGAGNARDTKPPRVTLTAPTCGRKLSAAACRTLRGTAAAWRRLRGRVADDRGVTKLTVNVVRSISKTSCQAFTGSRFTPAPCSKAGRRLVTVKPAATGAFAVDLKSLKPGRYTIRIRATDAAGNVGTANRSLTLR